MFWRADTGEDVFEVVADELPYACGVELLRSIERPLLEHGRYAGQYFFGLAEMRMQSGECDRGLAGVLGLTSDRGHQPRPAGDGLATGLRVGQRVLFLPARPQPGECQKFDEIRQLPHRRGRARTLPAHLHPTTCRLQSCASGKYLPRLHQLAFRFTYRVTSVNVATASACLILQRFAKAQLGFLG